MHNWKKVRREDAYPRYHRVIRLFQDHLASFRSFLDENDLGSIEPLQYEMTYRNKKDRFLPIPEGVNWRTAFVLPEKTGRLHIAVRNVKVRDTGHPLLLLEITVRGIGPDKSAEGLKRWFDLARKWIVLGFTDLTGNEVQREVWKRRL